MGLILHGALKGKFLQGLNKQDGFFSWVRYSLGGAHGRNLAKQSHFPSTDFDPHESVLYTRLSSNKRKITF